MTFLTILLLLVDCSAWRIVRLPLEPFYLMRPFCISAIVVSCAGYVCVPLLRSLKIYSIIRREGPARHSSKKGTPTMGGLFFVPIGIIVAEVSVGFSSIEVRGAAVATLAFAAIGLLDDVLSIIKNHNYGLSALMKILLEVKHAFLHPFTPSSLFVCSLFCSRAFNRINNETIFLSNILGLLISGKVKKQFTMYNIC